MGVHAISHFVPGHFDLHAVYLLGDPEPCAPPPKPQKTGLIICALMAKNALIPHASSMNMFASALQLSFRTSSTKYYNNRNLISGHFMALSLPPESRLEEDCRKPPYEKLDKILPQIELPNIGMNGTLTP